MNSSWSRNDSIILAEQNPGISEEKIYKKVILRIIPLFMMCYLFANLDRVNISFAKLQMLESLKFTDTVYALGASMFFWGYFIFEVPANMILHKIGARRWIALILFVWGGLSALTMAIQPLSVLTGIPGTTLFYTLRLLLGICEAGFYPGVILYLNYWFPSHLMSKATSVFLLALPVASVLGGPLSGLIMQYSHLAYGLEGWQWMMLIEGVPASLLGIFTYFWLSNGIDDAGWLTETEKNILHHNLVSDNTHKQHSFSVALKDVRLWILCLIILMYNSGYYGMTFWLPSIISYSGVQNVWTIGLITAVPYLFGAIAMVLIPWHSRKMNERRLHTALPPLIGGVCLMLSAFCIAWSLTLSMFFMTLAAVGLFGMMPVFWTLPGTLLSGAAAAAGIAMINSFGALSGFMGSFISDVAKNLTGNINNGTYLLGLCLLICGVLFLLLPSKIFHQEK
ncbi:MULTISPECIES: MFS transporter [Enterobacteriaceae]|uniref:MFS transporter n=1 Tax=Enterobacteriaceae TaxID=543 RepID=UPI00226BA411|nr:MULTISPECIES: MFS transporter [Enterobacteriaceae]MCX9044831.1 MFS transporter [Citrobacter portucalensis]MDA8491638.1 MFS transporter [Kluyvera sp. Awk 3]